jgi:hypothetical protein
MNKKTKKAAKTAKKPKIVQISVSEGFGIVLYDDGRVFVEAYSHVPLPDGGTKRSIVWKEIKYPLT